MLLLLLEMEKDEYIDSFISSLISPIPLYNYIHQILKQNLLYDDYVVAEYAELHSDDVD